MQRNNTSNKRKNKNNRPMDRTKTTTTNSNRKNDRYNWIQRLIIKKAIKKAKKKLQNYKNTATINATERKLIENAVIQLTTIYEVTNEKGQIITETNIQLMPEEKLTKLFEELLNLFKKEI